METATEAKKNIDDLEFVRITRPEVFGFIPQYLFEQIKDLDGETIKALYQNAANILMIPVINDKGQVIYNLPKQNVWFAVLQEESHQIKGFLWVSIDSIEKCVYIQATAWDKEYQSFNGDIMKKGIDYIHSLPFSDDVKSNIRMATIKPKKYEKFGWKRSKKVLMEFQDEPKKTSEDSVLADDRVVGEAKPEVPE